MEEVKRDVEGAAQDQQQWEKDLQSTWGQTRAQIGTMMGADCETLARKAGVHRREDENFLRQVVDLKKQHSVLRGQIDMCRARVQALREQLG